MIIDNYRYGCDLVEIISAELTGGTLPRQKRNENGPKNEENKQKENNEGISMRFRHDRWHQ